MIDTIIYTNSSILSCLKMILRATTHMDQIGLQDYNIMQIDSNVYT